VEVLVLEKHRDFLRDFRGDTVHPSTLQVMHELGLLEKFLRRPHQKVARLMIHLNGRVHGLADFSRLRTQCRFLAFMPQWEFLDFLSTEARRLPQFRLRMGTEVTDLLWEGDRVAGVSAQTPGGVKCQVGADLVIGADGRSSLVRKRAGLEVCDLGAPIDVLWFRLSKLPGDPPQSAYHVIAGHFMVLIDRDDYWQCAYVTENGAFDAVRERGLDAFRATVARCVPFLHERVGELTSWEPITLLTVKLDRLRSWTRDGLLCIGDSAHAMSPVGGVGIGLAIQDAVAAARLLTPKLRRGAATLAELRAVQSRREFPTRLSRQAQVFAHRNVVRKVLEAREPFAAHGPSVVSAFSLRSRESLAERLASVFDPNAWEQSRDPPPPGVGIWDVQFCDILVPPGVEFFQDHDIGLLRAHQAQQSRRIAVAGEDVAEQDTQVLLLSWCWNSRGVREILGQHHGRVEDQSGEDRSAPAPVTDENQEGHANGRRDQVMHPEVRTKFEESGGRCQGSR
jgi:2-polyprenyl-6-methoxyphenol hydroxylase-like FAD-dependent oxidoreductase